MNSWVMSCVCALLVLAGCTSVFLFVVTRGALLLRSGSVAAQSAGAHVYPIYSNMRLIKLVDFQPAISAILLFQYSRLVSRIISEIDLLDLKGKNVLITSCAFGNMIPRVVNAALEGGAARVVIADIVRNELVHVATKLGESAGSVELIEDDATAMDQTGGKFAANVMFFLLHELPHPMKGQALGEAGRMLAPGGKLLLAEFHRPAPWLLRALSWTYFKVFEPLGLALWDTHDPLVCLENAGGWTCERTTFFFGNFQVITATKRSGDGLAEPPQLLTSGHEVSLKLFDRASQHDD